LIRITSFALAKSPMSLTQGDEVPHVLTRKSCLQPAEFLITSAKRLLQQNRHVCDMLGRTANIGIRAAFDRPCVKTRKLENAERP
jgi:hypothetical protein